MGWFNHQVIPGKVAKARVADAEADAAGSRSEQTAGAEWVGFLRGFFLEFLWGLGKPFSGEATVRLCWGG